MVTAEVGEAEAERQYLVEHNENLCQLLGLFPAHYQDCIMS